MAFYGAVSGFFWELLQVLTSESVLKGFCRPMLFLNTGFMLFYSALLGLIGRYGVSEGAKRLTRLPETLNLSVLTKHP